MFAGLRIDVSIRVTFVGKDVQMTRKKRRTLLSFGKRAAIGVAFAAVFAILFSCNLFNLGDAVGYVPGYSQLVGPEGGTVTDGRGDSVLIPEGALAELNRPGFSGGRNV